MNQVIIENLFALLRCAIREKKLEERELNSYSDDLLRDLAELSKKHDVSHLLELGLDSNSLLPEDKTDIGNEVIKAIYRYQKLNYEYLKVCGALEEAKIPFIPLKGSVLREYYPQPWMRTSCDIDILVHGEDLEAATACLTDKRQCTQSEKTLHDISLFTKQGIHIELHFDLVEDGRANRANDVLKNVWSNVHSKDNYTYWHEMTDEFFYFYHIAHMAKHFEIGGCGIRPFIDLWILDNIKDADELKRNKLLEDGGLLKFSDMARSLSKCWLESMPADEILLKMQNYVLSGGAYGTWENKIVVQHKKKGGRVSYLFSRLFIPYSQLKLYYPILEKHPWLTPFMQVRRWFRLFNPDVAKRARDEIALNQGLDKSKTDEIGKFLYEIGL